MIVVVKFRFGMRMCRESLKIIAHRLYVIVSNEILSDLRAVFRLPH